jgi:hypothetical protein
MTSTARPFPVFDTNSAATSAQIPTRLKNPEFDSGIELTSISDSVTILIQRSPMYQDINSSRPMLEINPRNAPVPNGLL